LSHSWKLNSAAGAIAAAILAAGFSGCAVGPNYRPAQMDLPADFGLPTALDYPATAPTTRPAAGSPARAVQLAIWWKSLNDPVLDSLVQRAVRTNYDLRIAGERLQEARAMETSLTGSGIGGVGSTPGVDVSLGAGRGTGSNSTKGRVAPPLNAATNTQGYKEITQVFGFDSAWEIDFFGRYTRLIESADADTQAVAEARNDVLVSLIADVVRSYVDLRSFQFRLDVARQNVATQKQTLEFARTRLRLGLGNDLDVALGERQYSAALAKLAPLQAAISSAERRVAVLLGQMPDSLHGELGAVSPLPSTPPQVATGMPVDLLRRRPDVRRVERTLAASTARIGVATADLFPRVIMTGGAGWQGQGLGQAPVLDKFVYSVGPSLYWPFLDFGRLDAMVQAQDYHTRGLLLMYQKTVITAVQEVDDALSNYTAEQNQLLQLGNAVEASKRAAALATSRYNNGLTDFLNVLDAQRQLYDLEDQYAVAQSSVIWQFVALYKALGGGWEGYEAPSPPPPPMPAIFAAGARTLDHGDSAVHAEDTAGDGAQPKAH
jgi:NodT family efflux transporter outer membrane factor (OMF) lipoprotein